MKYYLIAGEASGDLHASRLMRAIAAIDSDSDFRFFGGDKMKESGGTLVKHYREMAFMGVVDVIANIRTISKNLTLCKNDIIAWQPDVLILVDYAGFNLRIAEFAKTSGFKVFYYIAPKVWAWKKSRIKKIKAFTDMLFVIFPFEVEYFKSRGVEAEYYGNPLMDSLADFRKKNTETNFRDRAGLDERPVIALLSGSRVHEISRCLPAMLEATDEFQEYQRVIAGALSIDPEYYTGFLNGRDVKLVHDQTYELLDIAKAAVVTSGTATLETALFRVPQVVVYRTNPVQYELLRHIVKIKFFSLVNIIAGKEVVKELLQKKLVERTNAEMKLILKEQEYFNKIRVDYDDIIIKLGQSGCSEQIASRIINLLQSPVL